jgi:hypothetical protein
MSNEVMAPSCIYTIKVLGDLHRAWLSEKATSFRENTNWATARRLLEDAQAEHQILGILFGTAESIDCLRYAAILTHIDIAQAGDDKITTTYRFENLRQLSKPYRLPSLRLRSTGKPLSENYIRPYAICHLPEFLPYELLGRTAG